MKASEEHSEEIFESRLSPAPFLKWAGGKRWLVERHRDVFPDFRGKYLEPFLGGGSVFFHLRPNTSVLSDINNDLIECYQQIRDNPRDVRARLKVHHERHGKEYYYSVRGASYSEPTERAAQFLYLNRTCWNGLYRVNLKGKFNVPIGTKSKVLFDHDDFERVSVWLGNAEFRVGDFETTIDLAASGDFIFVDPPYTVKHNFNGFLKYNEKIFSWDDQVRLRDAVVRASSRGAKVLVSNAAHSSVIELYSDVGEISYLERGSVLAGKKEARGVFQEILVSI